MTGLATALPAFEIESEAQPAGVSSTYGLIVKQWAQAREHFRAPISREPIQSKFAGLAATWKEETGFSSSLRDLVLSPSYQRIIGLGPRVVPWILAELSMRPDHWFWALNALTGVNPAPQEASGDLRALTEAWLRWGDEQGLLD